MPIACWCAQAVRSNVQTAATPSIQTVSVGEGKNVLQCILRTVSDGVNRFRHGSFSASGASIGCDNLIALAARGCPVRRMPTSRHDRQKPVVIAKRHGRKTTWPQATRDGTGGFGVIRCPLPPRRLLTSAREHAARVRRQHSPTSPAGGHWLSCRCRGDGGRHAPGPTPRIGASARKCLVGIGMR